MGSNPLMAGGEERAARELVQAVWLAVLHPEVAGVFPFVFCDEWYVKGTPERQDEDPAEHWGLVTADRHPKASYRALASTYADLERLDRWLTHRSARPEVLVTDQCVDWWRGMAGPAEVEVHRQLLRHGVSFRSVSLLAPEHLDRARCRKLILIDSALPDGPDGRSAALELLLRFVRRGGDVLYLSRHPWQGVYGPVDLPASLGARTGDVRLGRGTVRMRSDPAVEGEALWFELERFLGARGGPRLRASATSQIFWRVLAGGGQRMLLAVNAGPPGDSEAVLEGAGRRPSLAASDGARLQSATKGWRLGGDWTYALVRLSP